jgi:hypothetical protein
MQLSDPLLLGPTRGSHRQLQHSVTAGTLTVAGKAGVDIPIGSLKGILKLAGIYCPVRGDGDGIFGSG